MTRPRKPGVVGRYALRPWGTATEPGVSLGEGRGPGGGGEGGAHLRHGGHLLLGVLPLGLLPRPVPRPAPAPAAPPRLRRQPPPGAEAEAEAPEPAGRQPAEGRQRGPSPRRSQAPRRHGDRGRGRGGGRGRPLAALSAGGSRRPRARARRGGFGVEEVVGLEQALRSGRVRGLVQDDGDDGEVEHHKRPRHDERDAGSACLSGCSQEGREPERSVVRRVNSRGECGAPRGRGGGKHGVQGDSGGFSARGPCFPPPDLRPPPARAPRPLFSPSGNTPVGWGHKQGVSSRGGPPAREQRWRRRRAPSPPAGHGAGRRSGRRRQGSGRTGGWRAAPRRASTRSGTTRPRCAPAPPLTGGRLPLGLHGRAACWPWGGWRGFPARYYSLHAPPPPPPPPSPPPGTRPGPAGAAEAPSAANGRAPYPRGCAAHGGPRRPRRGGRGGPPPPPHLPHPRQAFRLPIPKNRRN